MFACTRKVAAAVTNRNSMNVISRSMAEKVALPSLPYGFKDLEPVISGEIMELHHSKHHATYVTNYNAALDKLQEATAKSDATAIIQLAPALKFNGGGHINHSIFWTVLSKDGGQPDAALLEAIKRDFGSLDNLKTQLSTVSTNVQGSGWGWLGYNSQTKKLQLATCANQDPLQATTGLIPLFGIDVWEHAYYLQYKNVRAQYTKAILDIINWNEVSRRYKAAVA